MSARNDQFRGFRFLIEIQGIIEAGFNEVTIPATTSQVIEHRNSNDPPTTCKIPGLNKNDAVICKKGITDSMDLFNWHKDVVNGKIARKNLSILLLDELGNEVARWNFVQTWPAKYDAPDLNAKNNAIAIETLEIAHEGMTRVK